MKEVRNAQKFSAGIPEERHDLEIYALIKDNIKIDREEIGCEDNCIYWFREKCRSLMSTVVLRFSYGDGNFLTN
jgi:hypothetical protein